MKGHREGRLGLVMLAGMAVSLIAASAAQAAFPGKIGKIAFDWPQPSPPASGFELQIDLIDPDGTGRAALTGAPVNDLDAAWSADGKRIVFTRRAGLGSEIWVINADGTGATRLTSGNEDVEPAFSGDGTKVVFARNDGAPQFDNEIWVMNADGSNPVKLTDNSFWDTAPVFSPHSDVIAFESDEAMGTGNAIYVMNPDGTGRTARTPVDGAWRAGRPDWSPDGSRLTFWRCDDVVEGCDVQTEIVTIPATAPIVPGQETELTTHAGSDPNNDFDPVYSPDGTRIAFTREDFNAQTANVFTVPAGGGTDVRLTLTDQDRRPDWQPILKVTNRKKCRGVPVTITSTNKPDTIIGTPGRDVVHGQRGKDVIQGMGGNDRLCGGREKDHVHGGSGNDILFGGDHVDFIFGDAGFDKIFGGTPRARIHLFVDHCWGGSGRDSFRNCQRRKGLDKKFGD